MKKSITLLLSIIIGVTTLVGCNQTKEESIVETKDVKVVAPDGLPAISLSKLAKENPHIVKGYKIGYSVLFYNSLIL